MPFEWISFLNVAERLIAAPEAGIEEAYFRSAVSRTYYGLFGTVRQTVEKKGQRFSPINIHSQVIKFLKRSKNPLERKIGAELDRLRKERVKADYEAGVTLTKPDALQIQAMAKRLKAKIDRI
jgi:uncharacterized protein (UPF0332 family)